MVQTKQTAQTDPELYRAESPEYYDKVAKANNLDNPSGGGASADPAAGLTPIKSRYDTAVNEFANSLPSSGIPSAQEQASIREAYRASAQKEIDAINQVYLDKVKGAEEAGKEREGMERAMSSRGGLLGSPMGESRIEKQRTATRQETKAIANEQALQIQQIQDRADQRAEEAISRQKTERWQGATTKLTLLKEVRDQANNDFIELAKSGRISVDDFKKKNPEYWNQFKEEMGISDEQATLKFMANLPKDLKTDWQTQFVKGDNGKNKIFMYGVNPTTNQLETKEFDVNIDLPENASEYNATIADDGTLIYAPKEMKPGESLDDFKKRIFIYGQFEKPESSGLTDYQTITRIDKITGQFDTEPVVRNFSIIAEGYDFAKSMSDTTTNPADDQALIYAFAKAMDPSSVVREGEYATVQKYSQSWLESFGFNAKRVVDNSEFLTPEARNNIKSTIEKRFKASFKNYQNIFNEYGRRIDDITGQADGARYLTDYSKGYGGGQSQETRIYNGKTYVKVEGGWKLQE